MIHYSADEVVEQNLLYGNKLAKEHFNEKEYCAFPKGPNQFACREYEIHHPQFSKNSRRPCVTRKPR